MMTQLTESLFAVEVPEGMEAFKVECMPEVDLYELNCYEFGEYDEPVKEKSIDLPPGTWQLLCTTKEATEEQAKGIVGSSEWYFPSHHTRYIDYAHPYNSKNKQEWSVGFSGSRDSLRSLLTSKGLDLNRNYCLLKKIR